jgi:uncharacterized membrane protein SpoIIM required for sporulation
MKQHAFEALHQAHWQRLRELLQALEKGQAPAAGSEHFAHDYRRLCRHLAVARQRGYSSYLVDELEHLALRGHRQLYRHRGQLSAQVLGFVLAGLPRQVRAEWRFVLCAALLFYVGLLLTAVLVYLFPDLVQHIISPAQLREMEAMYDPDQSRLGRAAERLASEDWMMFGYYIMNNIGIAFQTYASGLLFGLGSLFFLFFNGLTIGAVAGHLSEIGYGQTFWAFVIGHGAFELNAIVLAGAAGLRLGWALLAPGQFSRGHALRQAAAVSVQLVYGVVLMLLLAAFLEAYWSARTSVAPLVKYCVGAGLWLAVLGYFALAGRGSHATD